MFYLSLILGYVASYPLSFSELQDFKEISELTSNLRNQGEEINLVEGSKNVHVNKSHIITTIEIGTPPKEYELFLTQSSKFTVVLSKSSSRPEGLSMNESSTIVCNDNILYYTF